MFGGGFILAFFVQNTLYFAELLRKILPVQIRAQTKYHNWAYFIHGGFFFYRRRTPTRNIL
jgi:hypothetical protein